MTTTKTTVQIIFVLAVGYTLSGCCGSACETEEQGELTVSSGNSTATGGIAQVDFKNFTYNHPDMGKVTTVNGDFMRDMDGLTESLTIGPITYGDVDGKPGDEAIVIHTYHGGGTGQLDAADIYTWSGGKATLLTTLQGGDRGHGGLKSVVVTKAKTLKVERLHATDPDSACCAEKMKIETWRFAGGKLTDAGKTKIVPLPK